MLLVPFSGRVHNAAASSNPSKGPSASIPASASASSVSSQARYGNPARLTIPAINVDAAVEHLGLTTAGAMDVPKGRIDVAWFKLGPHPGDLGSAVIAGHRARKDGTAVFDNLNKLRKGDVIYVEDSTGRIVSFVVRESRIYDANARPTDVFASDSGAHLNLITCGGDWSKSLKGFNQRLVVFTDLRA